jgi:hypothetical protein
LDLDREKVYEWNFYVRILTSRNGEYTMNLGYREKMEEEMEGKSWWSSVVWKLESPFRAKIFMWLALDNKILTWDNF